MNVNSIKDHLAGNIFIVRCCPNNAGCSVVQACHGIVEMDHMGCPSLYSSSCCLIVSTCVGKGNLHLVLDRRNVLLKFRINFRGKTNYLNKSLGSFHKFIYHISIALHDVGFILGTFLFPADKWAFHVKAHKVCAIFRDILGVLSAKP